MYNLLLSLLNVKANVSQVHRYVFWWFLFVILSELMCECLHS